jgi:ribokinase
MTAAPLSPGRIVVVGASNVDLVSYVPRLPAPGETLHGSAFEIGYGGKGANQAVMAARLGSRVSLVTKLGRDAFGQGALEHLRANGIDTTHAHVTDEAPSGVAPIAVTPDGTNAIIIVTGANDLLTVDEIELARPAVAAASAVVCQLEIPLEVTLAALRTAREEGALTILTPAPASDVLPDELFRLTDVLCPNEGESELLTGGRARTDAEAVALAQVLRARGPRAVVLTLGERGCLVVDDDGATALPGHAVEAVDTTGAGDAFVGSLAHFLSAGDDLRSAARRANLVAAVSVRRRGTQPSFPTAADLPADLWLPTSR